MHLTPDLRLRLPDDLADALTSAVCGTWEYSCPYCGRAALADSELDDTRGWPNWVIYGCVCPGASSHKQQRLENLARAAKALGTTESFDVSWEAVPESTVLTNWATTDL